MEAPLKTNIRLTDVLSGVAFGVAVLALVSLFYQHHLFASKAPFMAVQAGAVFLMIWARLTFGRRSFHATASTTEGGVVRSGPFRYLRHPIYASILYFAWAGQIESRTIASIGAGVVLTVALGVRILLEERSLMETYPEYKAYSKEVKRVLPFIL